MTGQDDPASQISLTEANVLNQLSLIVVGAWASDIGGFRTLIQERPAPRDKPFSEATLFKYLRTDLCLFTMQQLVFAYLVNPRKGYETFSQNTLAELIGLSRDDAGPVSRKKQDSNRKRLGDWILPALNQAKLIDGYRQKGRGDYSPHQISISQKGVRVMLAHYERVRKLTAPLFEEWASATRQSPVRNQP
jgi:hypothetical protein